MSYHIIIYHIISYLICFEPIKPIPDRTKSDQTNTYPSQTWKPVEQILIEPNRNQTSPIEIYKFMRNREHLENVKPANPLI